VNVRNITGIRHIKRSVLGKNRFLSDSSKRPTAGRGNFLYMKMYYIVVWSSLGLHTVDRELARSPS
jgi:hypothetical protein